MHGFALFGWNGVVTLVKFLGGLGRHVMEALHALAEGLFFFGRHSLDALEGAAQFGELLGIHFEEVHEEAALMAVLVPVLLAVLFALLGVDCLQREQAEAEQEEGGDSVERFHYVLECVSGGFKGGKETIGGKVFIVLQGDERLQAGFHAQNFLRFVIAQAGCVFRSLHAGPEDEGQREDGGHGQGVEQRAVSHGKALPCAVLLMRRLCRCEDSFGQVVRRLERLDAEEGIDGGIEWIS